MPSHTTAFGSVTTAAVRTVTSNSPEEQPLVPSRTTASGQGFEVVGAVIAQQPLVQLRTATVRSITNNNPWLRHEEHPLVPSRTSGFGQGFEVVGAAAQNMFDAVTSSNCLHSHKQHQSVR